MLEADPGIRDERHLATMNPERCECGGKHNDRERKQEPTIIRDYKP